MTEIYADVYFCVNLSMDLLCLYLCRLILRRNVSLKRLFFGALLGGAYSILSLFIKSSLLLLILTVLAGILISLTAFGKRRLLAASVMYISVSFFMGGALSALYSVIWRYIPSYTDDGGIIFIIASLLAALLSLTISKTLKRRISTRTENIKIIFGQKAITVTALVDSGNLLKEPISGLPVILLCQRLSKEMLDGDDISIDAILKGKPQKRHKLRIIPQKTRNGTSLLPSVIPDSVIICNEERLACVAFTEYSSFGGCEALLPGELL